MKLTKIFFVLCFIIFVSEHFVAQATVSLEFERNTASDSNPNQIKFMCRNGAAPVTIEVYRANNNSSPLARESGIGIVEYEVMLSPSNELYVICTGDRNASDPVYFAAIPVRLRMEPEIHLTTDNLFSLWCPFELGIASDRLDPYHYVWFIDDMESMNQISQTFNDSITEDLSCSAEYSCALRIRDCNTSDCSISVYPTPSFRPSFKVMKVESLSIIGHPDSINISFDSTAEFNCSARGTNISFEWEYNSMNYTSDMNACSDISTSPCVKTEECSSICLSKFTIPPVFLMNSTIRCLVHQSFNESYKNSFSSVLTSDANLTVMSMPSTQPPMTMPTTIPTTMTTTTAPQSSADLSLLAAFVSLGVIAVAVVTITMTIILSLTFHYHYKYKTDSKLGRFLSRAVSSRPSHRLNRESDLPSNGNGEVLSSVFQPASDFHRSQSRSISQEQEQIYNISQYSKSSGGSYSGLSGVSNQEPGAIHKMPNYCATDVSGGSTCNPQSSITTDGLLAPPHLTRGNSASRSQRSSDVSGGSNLSQSKAPIRQPRLTQELLNQMQKAVSFEGINGPQSYSGYPNYEFQNNQPHHHSDHGFLSRQHQSQEHFRPPLKLLPKYSPVGAAVSTKSPYIQGEAPFPHCRTPQNGTAPFPSKHTNNEQRISEDTIETVMKCLMHNKDCRIPNCPCYKVQEKYKSTTGKQNPTVLKKQQSISSDSVSDKKKTLHLSLSPKVTSKSQDFIPQLSQDDLTMHPHYHRGVKSRARSSNPRPLLERKRSKSVDLSPLGECSESPTKTPTVGASLIAGTPVLAPYTFEDAIANQGAPEFDSNNLPFRQLAPRSAEQEPVCCNQGSMSADDLPTLCLNDCPLASTFTSQKLRPPPVKRVYSGKPKLSPIGEKCKEAENDAWQSSNSSKAFAKMYSDHDADSAHGEGFTDSILSQRYQPVREISHGYHSETLSSEPSVTDSFKLKPKAHQNLSSKCGSDHSQRSTSPAYETIVTVSDDGNRVHTTEC